MVLGRLVEKLTGKTLDKALRDNLLTPLGLRDTGYQPLKWVTNKARLVATDARSSARSLRHILVCVTKRVSGAIPRSRPGGRTAQVTERVLDATVELIARRGVAAVTFDAVAKLSGVGRATLYRRWPQRDDLLRAALIRFAESSVSTPDTDDIRSDIVELLCGIGETLATPIGRAIINASIMAADDDPIRKLGQDVLETRLGALRVRIDKAVTSGELSPVDVSFLNTMLIGPVYIHVMRDRRPLTAEFAVRVVKTVFDGL